MKINQQYNQANQSQRHSLYSIHKAKTSKNNLSTEPDKIEIIVCTSVNITQQNSEIGRHILGPLFEFCRIGITPMGTECF